MGAAVFGALADLPLLGLAGAVVAAVPAVLAARYVPALQAEVAAHRAQVSQASVSQASVSQASVSQASVSQVPVSQVRAATAAAPLVPTAGPVPGSAAVRPVVDLVRAEHRTTAAAEPAIRTSVDLVKAPAPVRSPAPVPAPVGGSQHATVGARSAPAAVSSSRDESEAAAHARVDTAELQLIWDLGEASRSRSGHGRRTRTGAEVDALPDRARTAPSPRRRARHRA